MQFNKITFSTSPKHKEQKRMKKKLAHLRTQRCHLYTLSQVEYLVDLGADVAAVDRNKDGLRCFRYSNPQENRNLNSSKDSWQWRFCIF